MTYTDLTTELENLLHEIEHNPELPLDELTHKVQRAYVLIGEGRHQLRATEALVTRIIEDFAADNAADNAAEEASADDGDARE